MGSVLITTKVESLQKEINRCIKPISEACIYVSLNKAKKAAEEVLKKANVKTEKIFFIDCVATEENEEDVVNIKPQELDKISYAIYRFIKEIKGKKFIIIDSFVTFLIYNNENKVARFIKEITEYSSKPEVELIAISQKTQGEELLKKVYNFFDEVKTK
jgi:archaellum biogenesis ATPase FlaH